MQGCSLSHYRQSRDVHPSVGNRGKDGNSGAVLETYSTSHCPTPLSTAWCSLPPISCCPPGLSSCFPKHFFQCLFWSCSFVHLLNCAVPQGSAFPVSTLFCLLSLGKIPKYHLYYAETEIFIFRQILFLSSKSFLAISSKTTPKYTNSICLGVLPRHHTRLFKSRS